MSRHLLIAGTGRAGTSFLVRYLTKLGLETNLSRAGSAAGWHEQANAGLEDLPLPDTTNLPYVIKSPWTYQVIDDLLLNPAFEFDAVVIPMRDLTEAAASRCIIELQQMHNTLLWMRDLPKTWEHFAHTPGGIVFSTNAVDQARLLAVGFHHLLDQLVKADVPIILLSFPRLIEDADYLHSKLAQVLPQRISAEQSRAAHAETADRRKVRVGNEIHPVPDPQNPGLTLPGPAHEHLDRAALQRVFASVTHELEVARSQANDAAAAERAAQEARNRDLQDLQAKACQDLATIQELTAQRDRLNADLRTAQGELQSINSELSQVREARDRVVSTLGQLRDELESIHGATTWQIALRFQAIAKHLGWAVPTARWLLRPRPRAGLATADRA